MASFLLRSVEYALDRDLGSEREAFGDVPASNSHWANVKGAAYLGLVRGFEGGTYGAMADVRGDQMASFVVRVVDELVDQHTDGEAGEDPTEALLE